jgi:hypothetical protein
VNYNTIVEPNLKHVLVVAFVVVAAAAFVVAENHRNFVEFENIPNSL